MAKAKAKQDKGLNERIVFLTDAGQRKWLEDQSKLTGAPISTLIRRAIDASKHK